MIGNLRLNKKRFRWQHTDAITVRDGEFISSVLRGTTTPVIVRENGVHALNRRYHYYFQHCYVQAYLNQQYNIANFVYSSLKED